MKFYIKEKQQKYSKGYQEVDIDVISTGIGISFAGYFLSVANIPTISSICSVATGTLISIGSLPLVTLATGTTLVVTTAILTDEIIKVLSNVKFNENSKQYEYKFKPLTEIKRQSLSFGVQKNKEVK